MRGKTSYTRINAIPTNEATIAKLSRDWATKCRKQPSYYIEQVSETDTQLQMTSVTRRTTGKAHGGAPIASEGGVAISLLHRVSSSSSSSHTKNENSSDSATAKYTATSANKASIPSKSDKPKPSPLTVVHYTRCSSQKTGARSSKFGSSGNFSEPIVESVAIISKGDHHYGPGPWHQRKLLNLNQETQKRQQLHASLSGTFGCSDTGSNAEKKSSMLIATSATREGIDLDVLANGPLPREGKYIKDW